MTRRLATPRPLDRIGSIRTKLGVLVTVSIVATAFLTWYGLVILGWWPRYTLPVAVLVGLGVTQVLARGMTSPLRQMTAAAQAMAAGRAPRPVRTTSRDEVGELARAFTAMSADLAAADAQRRELLANVSHELRTPVAALRAQLENLVDGVREPDAGALAELLASAERLGGLVDDLLDLARADAGVTPLQPVPVDVDELVQEVLTEVVAARPVRGGDGAPAEPRMLGDVEPGLGVTADRARLRQVLVNLLDNALRHGGEAGTVIVSARGVGHGGLLLEVGDDGPGIPAVEREAVFERFQRGAASEQDGGTGLGLAIVRWAVTLHGGRISVLPGGSAAGGSAAGSGTRIRVELPGRATGSREGSEP